jgi:hypothetical protein
LEECVSIVLEIERISICLVDGHGISEPFGCEIAMFLVASSEARDEDSLSILKLNCILILGHDRYVK